MLNPLPNTEDGVDLSVLTRLMDEVETVFRGKRETGSTGMHETLTAEQRADRLRHNLGAFVVRVRSEPQSPARP